MLALAGLTAACAAAGRRGSGVSLPESPYVYDAAGYEDSLKAPFLYAEGLKYSHIYSDTATAMSFFNAAIAADSLYAPAWYEAAGTIGNQNPGRGAQYGLEAVRIDSTNQWYRTQLGRLYVMNGQIEEARQLYEAEVRDNPRNPENYNMLATIYQYNRQPYRAIMLLDSAETYLGRTDILSSYKLEILMSVGLYDRAIAESKALINDDPYDYRNYLALGQIYAATQKDSLAEANFDMALSLNSSSIDVIGVMNDYYMSRGNMPKFFGTARQIILSDQVPLPMKIRFYEDITGNLAFYRENYMRIEELAGLLLLKYPGDFEVMRLYAQNKIDAGHLEAALDFYKNNINDTLPDIRIFNMVLDIEAYLNRPDSVSKYARMAQEYFPKDAQFYIRQGSVLAYYMDRHKEAVASYEKALQYVETDSAQSVVYGLMGDIYQNDNDWRKASRSYEKALKLWPDNVLVLNNYAYHLSEQGRELGKALGMAEKVMELEPGNATYIDTYGWVLFKMGRLEEAKEQILRAISLDPRGSDEIFLHYGDVLYELGNEFLAPIYWRKAAEAGYDKEKIEERLKKLEKE